LGRAKIDGLEAALQIDLHPRWSLSTNFTWNDAIYDGSVVAWRGNRLPGIHEFQFNLHIQNYIGHGDFWFYEWSRDSGNFLDPSNLTPVPGRDITNAGITMRSGEFTATLEVKNIGDNRIADLIGYPLPGRAFYITVNRDMK